MLDQLRALATQKTLDGMSRYGLPSQNALGVAMGDIQALAKRVGKDHALAEELWTSGVYEGQLLACYVDDPRLVTPEQMDRWIALTDNWGTCDTVCFVLFDRTPHAFGRIHAWADRPEEFVKRGAFALLASVALHQKKTPDQAFLPFLPVAEAAASDGRNFVKKGVSWALRSMARREGLREPVRVLAERLSEADARWVGKDVLRALK